MVSVARWLDTFTCRKYADRFEQLGYSTLQSIYQLNSTQLQNLGVSPTDINTIMENVLLLKQSVNSLNSPRYLDLTSQPPPSSAITFPFQTDVVNGLHPSIESTSFNDFLPQQSIPEMMYRHHFYDTPSQYFYSPDQQHFMHANQRITKSSSWNNHQQFSHSNPTNQNSSLSSTNESYPPPLESLERLVFLPESQVIDPKSVVNEIDSPLSSTPIVSNLLTNGLKRCSTNDEQNQFNKKLRINLNNDINTENSVRNNHPVVTSLLTRSLSQTPLPSITSLQQKHNI